MSLLIFQLLCPSIGTVFINTYHDNALLFVQSETLFSREGTTQGDLLSLPFCALATISLIKTSKIEELSGEVWFADDATGCGNLHRHRTRWDILKTHNPKLGSHLNGCKAWLITKECQKNIATMLLAGTDVQITIQVKKHLRAPWEA